MHRLEGRAERRIARRRQAGPVEDRAEAGSRAGRAPARRRARPAGRRARPAPPRTASRLPDSSARSISPAVSWPVARRWLTSARTRSRRSRRECDGRLLAGFLGDALRAPFLQPLRATTKSASVADSLHQRWRVAAGRLSRVSSDFADGGEVRRSARRCGRARTARCRPRILDQRQAGFRRADLGDRGGDRARQSRGARSRPARRRPRSRPRRPDRHRPGAAIVRARSLRCPAGRRRAHGSRRAAPSALAASASASARRTSGEGSSSSMIIAPSAATRSSRREIGIR